MSCMTTHPGVRVVVTRARRMEPELTALLQDKLSCQQTMSFDEGITRSTE